MSSSEVRAETAHTYSQDISFIERIAQKKNTLVLGLSCILFLAVVSFAIKKSIEHLLVETARSTGMDWAHQIEAQVPMISDKTGSVVTPDAEKLSALADSIFSVGNIYQIDIINPNCYCDISLGSYASSNPTHGHSVPETSKQHSAGLRNGLISVFQSSHSSSHDHGQSNDYENKDHLLSGNRTPLSKQALQHIFNGRSSHEGKHLYGNTNLTWPVNRKVATHIVNSLNHDIYIRSIDNPNQPKHFAEVFHPVQQGEKLSYIIRVLVDLEDETTTYTMIMYGGAAMIIITLLLAFAYPTTKYLKTSRAEKAANRQAHYLARHDIMTNICNRNAFQEAAPEILRKNALKDTGAAFFHFDTDDFKAVNDTYGHNVGDKMLQEFASRLKKQLRNIGIVARLGGDEFIAIIEGLDTEDENPEAKLDLSELLSCSIENAGETITMHVSAGMAIYPRDGQSVAQIMQNCDLALYEAKKSDDRFKKYEARMGELFHQRRELREEFALALERDELEPYYQPLVNMKNGKVEGFEALVRWNHPKKGTLSPFAFEEMLTDHEFGSAITSTMLKKIIADMKTWKAQNVPFESIGLNIGEGDLLNPEFSQNVIKALSDGGILPSELAIEVTETFMFGANTKLFAKQMKDLKQAGCKIALDDFGTGYSSITQIKELPFSALKIDKSFVNGVVENSADQAIVDALVGLSKELNFLIVSEGVETEEQLSLLASKGCNLAQGYLYSKPVPAHQVSQVIKHITPFECQGHPISNVA